MYLSVLDLLHMETKEVSGLHPIKVLHVDLEHTHTLFFLHQSPIFQERMCIIYIYIYIHVVYFPSMIVYTSTPITGKC